MREIAQGSIWWLEQPGEKRRPCMVLTRDRSIPALRDVLVAPVTTRVRGLDTEVHLGSSEGVPRPSVANVQFSTTVAKTWLTRPIGQLERSRWHEVCEAMRVAIRC